MYINTIHILVILIFIVNIYSCTKPIPVRNKNTITISKELIETPDERELQNTLQIRWFGTSNYLISYGNNSIMTDPFVSYQNLSNVVFGNSIKSNDTYISKYYEKIITPDAIFIGHSHYDHLMDTVPLLKHKKDESGCNVPVYGSITTKNILHGYKNECGCSNGDDSKRWSYNSQIVETLGNWKSVETMNCKRQTRGSNSDIHYKAYIADHANHLELGPLKFKLFEGDEKNPLEYPPNIAYDFREVDTYLYIFKLIKNSKSVIIAIAGAATNVTASKENPENQVSQVTDTVDVLILCVPGWKYKEDYPGKLIDILRPKHILLSHFDNFFDSNRHKEVIEDVPLSDLDKFILHLQDDIESIDDYERFENIIIPDVNTTVYLQ